MMNKKTAIGLCGGFLWALDTMILGIALSRVHFSDQPHAVLLLPLLGTFFHDLSFAAGIWLYTGITKQAADVKKLIKSPHCKIVIMAAILGGPVGMVGYLSSIRYLGVAYTTMLTAVYPAIGAFLSWLFLKERLRPYQTAGLCLAIAGMALLGASIKGERIENLTLGFISIGVCVTGWALEIVLCAYVMSKQTVRSQTVLTIRQTVSAFVQFIILLFWSRGFSFLHSFSFPVLLIILCAGAAGMNSYLCYYRTIKMAGPSRAMALNITYVAWGIVFEACAAHRFPSVFQIFCSIMVIAGALSTAWERNDT